MTIEVNSKKEQKTYQRNDALCILKALACLMITNSHCREIYPWYFLAIGGGHGNGLFFVIAGFFLARIYLPFDQWIGKRTKRIIPTTIAFIVISILLGDVLGINYYNIVEVITYYVNKYWFVFAILLYYFIYYPVFKYFNARQISTIIIVWLVTYFCLYIFFLDKSTFIVESEGFYPFKVYFYFGVFLFGGLIRKHWTELKKLIDEKKKVIRIGTFLCAVLATVLWGTVYVLIMIFDIGYSYQCLIQIAVLIFSISSLICANTFYDFTLKKGKINNLITKISDSTLEIYLVQVTFYQYLIKLQFPINGIAFWGIALVGGVFTHWFIQKIAESNLAKGGK